MNPVNLDPAAVAYKQGYEDALNECLRKGMTWARSMFANNASHLQPAGLCACKDRPKGACPGMWEPGCDLGSNAAYAVAVEDPKSADETNRKLSAQVFSGALPTHSTTGCRCYSCRPNARFTSMVVCPDCGNKRCPKASNHRYACTNSNERGQIGSVYQ